MAQHKSAAKRARIAERRADRNARWTSRLRRAVKRVRTLTDKQKAQAAFNSTVKLLDQLAAKGIIHRNKAANTKSSLAKYVRSIA